MHRLIHFLNAVQPLPEELASHLGTVLKSQQFQKKDYLLNAGQVCRNIYFIESGLVRCFYLKTDKEVCSWFMKEEDVIISVESFFFQKESYESIQALEPTLVHYISYEELQFIYQRFPEFNYIARLLTEKYYALSEQRLYAIRMQRADERYQFMQANFPDLIRRIPSQYIASYLGITKETLSRIRGRQI